MRCFIIDETRFRRELLAWYGDHSRDLPWREAEPDFYRVWLSEIMLQQTRVAAAIPYYRRFLERFPSLDTLAEAPEPEVLAAWSGLGYYSRARNLHRAAKTAAAKLPSAYDEVLALSGVGPYTAAAVSSIVLGERRAAVDGNVVRVVSRLTNGAGDIRGEAQRLLDPPRPGDFNQAMMELGAMVCIPRTPLCGECPVVSHCEGRAAGRERELPVRKAKPPVRDISLDLIEIRRNTPCREVFLIQRGAGEKRLADFWELPEKKAFPSLSAEEAGSFGHRIVNDRFRITVWRANTPRTLAGGQWFSDEGLTGVPLTTVSRKALRLPHE